MLNKLFAYLSDKLSIVGTIGSFLLAIIITTVEIYNFQLFETEEIVSLFLTTFIVVFFIFLLIAKIIELNNETITTDDSEKEKESDKDD